MAFYVVQFLTGLASAASLFLVASGLSIIFGVTRIVNFAHGAFYMLGAYVAFTLTERFSGAIGFWGGIVAALGVNQKWLFTSVFALGVFLAALGGALQIPRDAVHHALDLRIIVDVFVVVVIGGLGSIIGAFVAAVLVSELNAFGILIFPKISIILVFLVMAVVLILRPWGPVRQPEAAARRTPGLTVNPWRPLSSGERIAPFGGALEAAVVPFVRRQYALTVGSEIAD